ncbi:hypothetical protein PYCC9005_003565 [Savitreella phatthalungensis]
MEAVNKFSTSSGDSGSSTTTVKLPRRKHARRLSLFSNGQGQYDQTPHPLQRSTIEHAIELENLSDGVQSLETGDPTGSGTTCAACCDTIAPELDSIVRFPDVGDSKSALARLRSNQAFNALEIDLREFRTGLRLTSVFSLPHTIVAFDELPMSPPATPPVDPGSQQDARASADEHSKVCVPIRKFPVLVHPPPFVQPHPPFEVFSAPVIDAHEMTKAGALKRVYHMSIDVSEYPLPPGEHWLVGGSFGVCAANDEATISDLLKLLGETRESASRPVTLRTTAGRWPTVWGDDEPRVLQTTKYELLRWCSDISSCPIKKSILRVLAEYADAPIERQILFWLVSRQGQEAFCTLRGGSPVTLAHLLAAFPSSRPPFAHLLSVLPQLYPRWYSLSSDPEKNHGTLDFAFTVAEVKHYLGHERPGVGSGFLEQIARGFIADKDKEPMKTGTHRLPMFRGLHSNPFTKDFADTGPMILIGAGVGIAPFRGFVQRRVASAKCAGKVYVIQGCRDSQFDGIYGSDLQTGAEHCIVESQAGRKEYVQDEVVRQGELIWRVMNEDGGRVYVCGAAKGFLSGIEKALRKVAMKHGGLSSDQATEVWKKWQDPLDLRLILEVW